MPNVIFLATAWGPKYGGINAFNMDLAIALAKHLGNNGRVFCAVLSCTEEEKIDAKNNNVYLFSINRQNYDKYDNAWAYLVYKELDSEYSDIKIDWWIGHDVKTGLAAIEGPSVKKNGGESALIMHMNYGDYKVFVSTGQKAAEKEREQWALFGKATRHFAVGPLLRDGLEDIIGKLPKMLVPGFPEMTPHPPKHTLELITFGRMDTETDPIKQGSLAVAGFARAVQMALEKQRPKNLCKAQMRLIGIDKAGGDQEKALHQLAARFYGEGQLNFGAVPYSDNRKELFDQLGRANIALMASLREGFGLTGWEAIAAEVPLIVSRNSGLWNLVEGLLGKDAENYLHVVDIKGKKGSDESDNFTDDDVNLICQKITDIAESLEYAQVKARELKMLLCDNLECTWEKTALDLYEELERPFIRETDRYRPTVSTGRDMYYFREFTINVLDKNKAFIICHKEDILYKEERKDDEVAIDLSKLLESGSSLDGGNSCLIIFCVDQGLDSNGSIADSAHFWNCMKLQHYLRAVSFLSPRQIVENLKDHIGTKSLSDECKSKNVIEWANKLTIWSEVEKRTFVAVRISRKNGSEKLSKNETDLIFDSSPPASWRKMNIPLTNFYQSANSKSSDDKVCGIYATVDDEDRVMYWGWKVGKTTFGEHGRQISDEVISLPPPDTAHGGDYDMAILRLYRAALARRTGENGSGYDEALSALKRDNIILMTLPEFLQHPVVFAEDRHFNGGDQQDG